MTLPQLPNASPTVPLAKLEYYTAARRRTPRGLAHGQDADRGSRSGFAGTVREVQRADGSAISTQSVVVSVLLAGGIYHAAGPAVFAASLFGIKKDDADRCGGLPAAFATPVLVHCRSVRRLGGCAYAIVYTVGHQSVISCVASAILAVAAAVMGHYARILRPTKIDTLHGYFRGASPEFLNSLPGVAAPPR